MAAILFNKGAKKLLNKNRLSKDKIYGTLEQYNEFRHWINKNKPEAWRYFYEWDNWTNEITHEIRPLALFPEEVDTWLLKHCPIPWVRRAIKDQYDVPHTASEKIIPARHPIQPLVKDKYDVIRFKENAIVQYLLDAGPFDMNHLALLPFDENDREQFAQLIGYSVSGFSDLSYVSEEILEEVEECQ